MIHANGHSASVSVDDLFEESEYQVILERSYSEDVEKVASHGSAYVRGLQEAGTDSQDM